MRTPRLLVLLVALVGCAGASRGDVTVRRTDYHGWRGAWRLSNGTVDLVFVPQIGRVMRFGFVGGPNVLWENPALRGRALPVSARTKEWANYGGDKLWPAPQARWAWPPDPHLDGAPQKVTPLPGRGIRAETPVSAHKGIRFIREIALDPTGAGVTFRNVMHNAGRKDVDWSVWEVAQIVVPQYAELPLWKRGRNSRGHYVFKGYPPAPGTLQVGPDTVRFRWNPKRSGKIGADSPSGWVRAVFAGSRLTLSAAFLPEEEYPDDGCGQEIWSNAAPLRYMELELLGPIRSLMPGEKQALVTRWNLEPLRRSAR